MFILLISTYDENIFKIFRIIFNYYIITDIYNFEFFFWYYIFINVNIKKKSLKIKYKVPSELLL